MEQRTKKIDECEIGNWKCISILIESRFGKIQIDINLDMVLVARKRHIWVDGLEKIVWPNWRVGEGRADEIIKLADIDWGKERRRNRGNRSDPMEQKKRVACSKLRSGTYITTCTVRTSVGSTMLKDWSLKDYIFPLSHTQIPCWSAKSCIANIQLCAWQ
jgi:hypothetical protein